MKIGDVIPGQGDPIDNHIKAVENYRRLSAVLDQMALEQALALYERIETARGGKAQIVSILQVAIRDLLEPED